MFEFLGFIFLTYLFWRLFFRSKKRPIDLSKTSDYYIKKYDLLKDYPVQVEQSERPQITVNITHNHLHIHTTPEGNQPR